MVWEVHDSVLAQHHVLSQHAIQGTTKLWGILGDNWSVEPAREHRRRHSIANSGSTHALTDGHNLPSAISAHDHIRFHWEGVGAIQHGELSGVEGVCAHTNEHLTSTWL